MCITWLMAVQYCLESESDNQVTFFLKWGGGVCEGWGVTCVIRSELTHVCNPITDVLQGFVWFCTISLLFAFMYCCGPHVPIWRNST